MNHHETSDEFPDDLDRWLREALSGPVPLTPSVEQRLVRSVRRRRSRRRGTIVVTLAGLIGVGWVVGTRYQPAEPSPTPVARGTNQDHVVDSAYRALPSPVAHLDRIDARQDVLLSYLSSLRSEED